MIAAIYARKSTEQSGISDEAKSIARQIEHAKAYAEKKGWTVDERFIFSDDAVSGAEFGKRRPGFLRLINALKPKPEFQVLVMSEESRLGREQIQTAYALQQITDAGVQAWFYLTDQERKLDTAMDKVVLSLTNFAAEMEREKAQQRVYDAMLRKAKAGHVCGGSCFGYTNVVITDASGKRSHVEYQIDPAESAVVKRIFELYVAGHGFQTIAKLLNAERALCPRARPLSKPAGWAASSVREVLLRPLYHGQQIWGRTKKRLPSGRKKSQKRPEAGWITVDVPQLQIIDDATWQEAQSRWNNIRATYLRGTNGRLHGRPTNGHESPYLLTGFTCCAHCGGSVYVRSRSHGNRRAYHYCCMVHYQRGPEACPERLLLPVPDVDHAILTALEQDVMQPAIITKALDKALQQLQADREDSTDRKEGLLKELRGLETELDRFTQAIAAGGSVPTILSAIQERETRRVKLQAELALLDGAPIDRFDAGQVEQELKGYLKDWSCLTSRHPAQTRQILRKLLPSRIRLSHDAEGVYRFEGTAAVGRMISGILGNREGKRIGVPNGI